MKQACALYNFTNVCPCKSTYESFHQFIGGDEEFLQRNMEYWWVDHVLYSPVNQSLTILSFGTQPFYANQLMELMLVNCMRTHSVNIFQQDIKRVEILIQKQPVLHRERTRPIRLAIQLHPISNAWDPLVKKNLLYVR